MYVLIEIHYICNDNRSYRKGSFPLRGQKKEEVALEFWNWIKKEHPFECEIEKIKCDGDDITDKGFRGNRE
ncbi:hypothetical protein F4694_004401 [Bacillus niacini]|uniref:Uncharacterized protein n=1 Tax=Neobacillus niacini TaxID=86668 RepID=A0A852TFC2_9BACI|nr:hypothetical protein [Neobacillus niacini]NYE07590.1 hypothetical protein [Neobacillus niacini]